MPTKAALRQEMLQRRQQLPVPEAMALSGQIADRFFAETDLSGISRLHIFLPIREKSEVNTWPIIQRLRNEFPQIKLAVPVTPPGAKTLLHRELNPDTELRTSKWGIEEPTETSPLVPETAIDLVLVPLLAFDLRGHRVGYGKGFYDRFLSACRPNVKTIGLSLFPPVFRIDDINEFDQPLQACITPEKDFRFS